MAVRDNFSNPKGRIGRLMLSGMNMGHSPMAKWAFTQLEVPDNSSVLDIGCGGGMNIKRLLKKCPKGHVFGVDISEESVRKSIAVNKKFMGKRCRIVQGSVEKLPFKDEVLDMATAFETVYFWPDLSLNFKEVYRVLKPQGRFAVINDPGDPDKHWEDVIPGMKAYSKEDIAVFMEGAGFTNIKTTTHKNVFCVIGQKE